MFPSVVDEDTCSTVKPHPIDFDDDAVNLRRDVWPRVYKKRQKPRDEQKAQATKKKSTKKEGVFQCLLERLLCLLRCNRMRFLSAVGELGRTSSDGMVVPKRQCWNVI